MAMKDTSLEAFEEVKRHLEPDQSAILSILDEVGPADDIRILEALNQKEAKTLKPRHLRKHWTINGVTPRRGELVEMGLLLDMGKYRNPSRRCAVHIWRVRGDFRQPAGDWRRIEKPEQIKNQNEKIKIEETLFAAGRA